MPNNPTPEAHAQEPILTAAELLVFGPPSFNDAGTRLAISTIRQLAEALEHARKCRYHPAFNNGAWGKCPECKAARDLLRRYNDGK